VKAQLPLAEPLAHGYQFYAFPLAILATVEESKDWILTNYVHLVYDKRLQSAPVPFAFYLFDYSQSPWLQTVKTDRFWVAASSHDIVDICRESIAAGYYPYLNLNEFHVPDREAFGTYDQTHDVLLSGFDDEAGSFTVYGYRANHSLGLTQVGYSEFRRSYESLDRVDNTCHQVYFYRVDRGARFPMDTAVVREAFEDYLAGANPSARFAMLRPRWDRTYGVDCYDPLLRYLDSYLAGEEAFDIRHFHVLWEHKRLMVMRLARLAEVTRSDALATLAKDFRPIERDALALRTGMLRRELAGGTGSRFLSNASERLRGIRTGEMEILEKAIQELWQQKELVNHDA
jgi:hypothetical protein